MGMAIIKIKMNKIFNLDSSTIGKISNYATRIIINKMANEMTGLKNDIRAGIKKQKPKFRKYYSRRHGKKFHWSSPPPAGNDYAPPNEDTGELRRGVRVHSFNNLVVLESTSRHAKYVEFAKNRRPNFFPIIRRYWVSPAFRKVKSQLTYAVMNSIRANILIIK